MKKISLLMACLVSFWVTKAAVTSPQDYSTIFAASAINANGTQLEKSTTFGVGTWYGSATGTQPSVATSTLSYSTYKDNTLGKQIALTSQSARYSNFGLTTTITDLTTGTFYLSFLLNLSNAPASSTFVAFNKSTTSTVNRGYIKVAKSGTQYLLTPIVSTTTGTSSQLLDFGTTYLIVIKYEVTTASNTAGAGTVSLFVNPTPGAAEPGTPTATVTQSGLTNMDYFKGFDVWQQSSLTGTIAGLRYSKNSWADAVPAAVPVSTSAVTSIAATTATGNGTLGGSLGTPAYSDYGICYKTSAGATINDSKVSLGIPLAIGAFTASLTGLTPNTTYYANAYATNSNGTTYGTEVSFLTLAAAPAAPTVDGITSTSVNIAINENGNPATTTFAIKENNSGKYVQEDGTISSATNVWHTKSGWGTKTVTGLTANTSYTFLAKAQNSASATVFGATTIVPTLPLAPTSTAASAITSAGFTANWTAPTQGAATFTYTVEYGTISDLSSSTTSVSSIISTNLSEVIGLLAPNTTYYYHVKAVNASGSGSWSGIQSVTTDVAAPGAPTIGTATAGNAEASVAFTAPSSNGGSSIIDYTVTSSPGGLTATGASSPIVVTGLTNGTAYTFTVTARNSVGSSSASDASNSGTPVSPAVTVLANANLSSYSPSSATDVTVSAGELTVDDNFSVKTMTVAPGAKLTLASGKTLTVVGALTLQSDDAHGTATFVDNDGSTLSTGSIDVQRYLKGGRNWYISSPVSSATANVFNVASSKDIVYNYSESTGTNNPWPQISTGSTALNVMQGYVVKLNTDTTINFTGTLNTGEQTTSFNRTIGQVKEGFNLVGNPYLSYVNIKDIQTSDTVHIETSYWLRSRNSGNTAYVFDTYNLKSGIGVANSGLKLTKYIPPMQAFWVRVKQGFTTGSLTLHNTLRAHQDSVYNVFRAPAASELTQQILRLQVSNGVITDETVLYTNSNASNGLDDYDSQKMNEGNITIPQIYTLAGTEQLAINGLNNISYDLEMPLGLTISTSGTFSLKASQISNFVSGTQLILKDYANIDSPINTDLSDGNTYSFSSGATTNNTSRFTLTFRAPSVATEINSTEKGSFWISTNANGQIIVNGNSSENTLVTIYNALGQKIVSKNITHANAPLGNSLQAGVYMITVSNAGKSITKKIIID